MKTLKGRIAKLELLLNPHKLPEKTVMFELQDGRTGKVVGPALAVICGTERTPGRQVVPFEGETTEQFQTRFADEARLLYSNKGA